MVKRILFVGMAVVLLLSSCSLIKDAEGFQLWNYSRLPEGFYSVSSHEVFIYAGKAVSEIWIDGNEDPVVSNPSATEAIMIRVSNIENQEWVTIPPGGDIDLTTIF